MSDPTAAAPTSSQLPEPVLPSRRSVLRVVAVSGAGAAVLAACGGGDDTVSAGGGGGSTSAPADEGSTPAGTPSEAEGEDGGAGGGLVATADVPLGGGVVLEGKKIVVTQPKAGQFKAFTAVCTHQQCLVSSVKDNTISCPCHGSTYSAADGSVKGGPAPAPLRAVAVSVEGDEVVRG